MIDDKNTDNKTAHYHRQKTGDSETLHKQKPLTLIYIHLAVEDITFAHAAAFFWS